MTKVKNDIVSIRLDHELKLSASKVLDKLGLTIADATRIFLKQVEMRNGLPFDVKIPNLTTIEAMKEIDDIICGKQEANSYSSFEDMLKDSTD